MWINPRPHHHVIRFESDKNGVRSLVWQQDRLMEAEVFAKETATDLKL
jgi:hypothetical protein